MPAKKPGYTIDQHEELGIELQAMRDKLNKIEVALSKAYPSNSKAPGLAGKAQYAIDQLRRRMDDLVLKEHHGNNDIDLIKIYYRAGLDDDTPI